MRDSVGGVPPPLGEMRFYEKNRGFLTHSRLDATYTDGATKHFAESRKGSRLRRRRLRVARTTCTTIRKWGHDKCHQAEATAGDRRNPGLPGAAFAGHRCLPAHDCSALRRP